MKFRSTNSASTWMDVWLKKYSSELAEKKLSATETGAYHSIVKSYLTENPGNPREIDTAKLKKFVSGKKHDVIAPLVLFYGSVAPSEKHLEVLAGMKKRVGEEAEKDKPGKRKKQ